MVHIVSLVTVDVTEAEIIQQCEKQVGLYLILEKLVLINF